MTGSATPEERGATPGEFATLRSLASEIAARAGAFLLEGIDRQRVQVDTKSSGTDMVSEMDRGAEKLIVDAIIAARPDDGLLGEEGADRVGSSGFRWVIDPLDGTTNYLYGHPFWSVSIGVEYNGTPVVGAVEVPMLRWSISAHTGGGATRNGSPIAVSRCDAIGLALIGTGFSYSPTVRAWQGEILQTLVAEVRDVRRSGSAAVDLCFVACGLLDGYYERGLNPWDACAGSVIVREAGGRATGLYDGEAEPNLTMTIAGNSYVHTELATRLRARIDRAAIAAIAADTANAANAD